MRLEQSWCSHANGFLCSLGLQRHPASRGRMNTACLKKHTNTQSFWSQSHSFWSHCPGTGGAFCWGLPADTEQPGSHRPASFMFRMAQLQRDALFKSFSQAFTPTHICSAFWVLQGSSEPPRVLRTLCTQVTTPDHRGHFSGRFFSLTSANFKAFGFEWSVGKNKKKI